MVPRPLIPLLVFCATFTLVAAAPIAGRPGSYDKPQAPAIVQKTITVEVMTPDGGWGLEIEEIRRVRDELWVFAKVARPSGVIAAMMRSAASDAVTGRFPDLAIKTFVVGKTWTWANEEPVIWLSKNDASERRRQGERVWRR
ncbi:MAG TPA: hypothetical protein PK322_15470 [Opitutaceae bacterium]|nr:hypothetical protein [Opitutaceae bacterium]